MTKRQQNANDLQDELNKALEDETDADKIKDAMDAFATGIVDYETKNIPTDLWVVNLGASAADEDDIDGGEAKIDFLDPDNDPDVSGALIVCRVNDHPSVSEDDNDLPFVKRDQNCYGALEADIEFVKWVAGETFEAKATATVFDIEDFDPLNDDEPKDVGEVEIAINAGFCQPLQDALDDAKEIAKDAQGG